MAVVPFYPQARIEEARDFLTFTDIPEDEIAECSGREVVGLMELNYRPDGMAGFVQSQIKRAEWRATTEAQLAREFSTTTEQELF